MKNNLFKKDWNEIEQYIFDIAFSKPITDRLKDEYLFTTGEFGMILFHRIISPNLPQGSIFNMEGITLNTKNTNKESLKKGSQFIKYTLSSGIKIKVQHDPNFDIDTNINPESGFPDKSSILEYEE